MGTALKDKTKNKKQQQKKKQKQKPSSGGTEKNLAGVRAQLSQWGLRESHIPVGI